MPAARSGARLTGGSGNDEIRTPGGLYARLDEAFQFDLDAFATHENARTLRTVTGVLYSTAEGTFWCSDGVRPASDLDGFAYPWRELRVFANPPYSRLWDAAEKFAREVDESAWQVMLVKWDTSTRWAQRLEEIGIVRPLRRRLRYENPGSPRGWSGATFASALVFPDRDWTKEAAMTTTETVYG